MSANAVLLSGRVCAVFGRLFRLFNVTEPVTENGDGCVKYLGARCRAVLGRFLALDLGRSKERSSMELIILVVFT